MSNKETYAFHADVLLRGTSKPIPVIVRARGYYYEAEHDLGTSAGFGDITAEIEPSVTLQSAIQDYFEGEESGAADIDIELSFGDACCAYTLDGWVDSGRVDLVWSLDNPDEPLLHALNEQLIGLNEGEPA